MSMAACFVDTAFWIALSSKCDAHHARAVSWAQYCARTEPRLVTTEMVLWEWLNALASPVTRTLAAEGYRRCHQDPHVEVVPPHRRLLEAAVQLYRERGDKQWSLTDCFSFVVMKQRSMVQALTADHHFVQAGFQALLLGAPPEG